MRPRAPVQGRVRPARDSPDVFRIISQASPGHVQPYDAIFQVMIFLTAAAAGMLSRAKRASIQAAQSRADRAEAELDRQSSRAAERERTRIARELHDVVAHHVSLIAVQAEAATSLLPSRPDDARRSVEIIGDTARQALTELRRLLGVLRRPSERLETAPSASLGELGDVLDQVRGAGLPVDLEIVGTPGPLAPGVDLTAYRIIQEALTNTIRHANATRAAIRVLVVDDQELVRSGFCVILDTAEGITVVGEAANGEAALAAADVHRPDVVLMDIRMPGMDGLEATRLLTRGPTAPKVVMLTTFDLDEYVYEALRAGASGFLLKDSPRADLITAVRAAATGNALLAPSVTRRLIEAFARRPPETAPSPARLASLTAREREVLVLLARGGSNIEIAAALFVSEATVKTHVGNLLAKLGLRDRVQAVILAYETGIIVPGDPSPRP